MSFDDVTALRKQIDDKLIESFVYQDSLDNATERAEEEVCEEVFKNNNALMSTFANRTTGWTGRDTRRTTPPNCLSFDTEADLDFDD